MLDHQIDPYKLNEVLQRILEGIDSIVEKQKAASPEFQALLADYLTKCNEAERNRVRFEESQERLAIIEAEYVETTSQNEQLKQKINSLEADQNKQKTTFDTELQAIRAELARTIQEKNDLEESISQRFVKELKEFKEDAEKQISDLQSELADYSEHRRKLEDKLLLKTKENDRLESEISEIKIRLVDEQANIRNEIIEASRRSQQLEQSFQQERDNLVRRVRELESKLEETDADLTIKTRELEYKDALLLQAFKSGKPTAPESTNISSPRQESVSRPSFVTSVSKSASIAPDLEPSIEDAIPEFIANKAIEEVEARQAAQRNVAPKSQPSEPAVPAASQSKNKIGGIWSKLN